MPIVPFTGAHLPALLDFIQSRSQWGSQGQSLGRKILQETFEQPWLDLDANCWLIEDNGAIKGHCLVHREPPINRAVLQLEVDPSLAGGDLERELLDTAVRHSRMWGAKVAHLCLPSGSDKRSGLEQFGFSMVRSYTNMVWKGDRLPSWSIADGYYVRAFTPGDAHLLTQVQNAAFSGSWGFCPNTADQIEHRAGMSNTRHAGILFLTHGEKPAGYCWTCLFPVPGGLKGVIGMIGVTPEFRGRGLSKSVLMAGMEYLQSENVAEIGLEVDSNNTPAIRLYTSVGFEEVSELNWFELELSLLNPGSV